ncbi:MAG: hypothetical protein ACREIV_12925 [Planctomycetaceae bacterium]
MITRTRRTRDPIRRAFLAICAVALTCAACDDSPSDIWEEASFTIETEGDKFTIRVADGPTITALEQRRADGTIGVIIGNLVAGDGGFNDPWSWHLDPATVRAVDVSIEVCSGTPSMVEADLDYWLELGQFCPWSARVVRKQE